MACLSCTDYKVSGVAHIQTIDTSKLPSMQLHTSLDELALFTLSLAVFIFLAYHSYPDSVRVTKHRQDDTISATFAEQL